MVLAKGLVLGSQFESFLGKSKLTTTNRLDFLHTLAASLLDKESNIVKPKRRVWMSLEYSDRLWKKLSFPEERAAQNANAPGHEAAKAPAKLLTLAD